MSTAKFTLVVEPMRKTKAWLVDLGDQGEHWIPFSQIKAYQPATKEIKIDTFILRQKNIKYKL